MIGVVDQTRLGSPADDHGERVDNELGTHVVGHGPAHDPRENPACTAAKYSQPLTGF
jgi:hypothetical protein